MTLESAAAYADLPHEQQAEALRPVVLAAADAFGLAVHRLEVRLHAYNTTYETTYELQTVGGERFALRINTNSTSPEPEILAQQLWQLAIARETTVLVPRPIATADGRWCARVPSRALGRDLLVTCASWLEGDDVGEPDAEVAHELGRSMAALHVQARTWQLPEGSSMPSFDEPRFGDEDLLGTAELAPHEREVVEQSRALAQEAFRRVYTGATSIALHADLHGGNLKWHGGRLAGFDFDDCGLGVPALDLAISTFYLRGGEAGAEEAMRAGYASVAHLPDIDRPDFEAMVASRQLLLANA